MSDLALVSDFTFDETPQFKTLVSEFENGNEQRRNKRVNVIRKWHLVYRNREKTDYETLRDFFILKKGAYTSFTWINPNDNTEYTVRFAEDSLVMHNDTPLRYSFEFDLVQDIQ